MRPQSLIAAVAVVACALHATTALPVKKPAASPLDAAPDVQQQLPLPQGFLLTRGVLTLSAPSEADAPSEAAAPQGSKGAPKPKSKTGAAPSKKPPALELKDVSELKESARGGIGKTKKKKKNDPTDPLNPAVAAALLNNAAASKTDATTGEIPTITMHVKGIKVLVNPKNKTATSSGASSTTGTVAKPAAGASAAAAWPQDTSEKDFAKNGKHSEGFPKNHKKRTDWEKLMGPSLFAPPNKTATSKHTKASAKGVPKVPASAKKPQKAAQKGAGATAQKKPGAGDHRHEEADHEEEAARSLVTRVSATPPLAGWDSVAVSPPAPAGKPAPGAKQPLAKKPPAAKTQPAKKKPAKASSLGEMAAPKAGTTPASKAKAKAQAAAKKPPAAGQQMPPPAGSTTMPLRTAHVGMNGQNKPTQMGTTQCKALESRGHLCSTTHSWPGYECKGSNCKSRNCRCHATKMASCEFMKGGGIKCSTGNVVTDCGGSKVKALVESACRRGAEGLL